MNLWWLSTSSPHCRYSELKRRRCIALGWPEIGSLSRHIRDKPGWERQFKTFVQVRGNLAYSRDRRWTHENSALTGVPSAFWNLLQIRKGDFVAVIEPTGQMSQGVAAIHGFARVKADAVASYRFDERFHHAHQVYADLDWHDWSEARLAVLPRPETAATPIWKDNAQLAAVRLAWDSTVTTHP